HATSLGCRGRAQACRRSAGPAGGCRRGPRPGMLHGETATMTGARRRRRGGSERNHPAEGSPLPHEDLRRRGALLKRTSRSGFRASELQEGARKNGFCYPSPTMAEAKLTKQEVKDLHERLVDERNELQMQLLTIEEDTFAATQSDSS